MKNCSKIGCHDLGTLCCSNNCMYCIKCYKFRQMQHTAQSRHKYVPTWDELEELLPKDLVCPVCKKTMIWHSKYDSGKRSKVISLQHNVNGTILLICCSCNVQHGNSHLQDDYFDIPKNHRYCPSCKKILLLNKFSNKRTSFCKRCNNQRSRDSKYLKPRYKKITSSCWGIYKKNKKWAAKVGIDYKRIYIGVFDTEEQAAIARDEFIIDNKLDITKYKLNYPMDFYD